MMLTVLHIVAGLAIGLAALIVATANQMMLQKVGQYPQWLLWILVFSPFLVMPRLIRALDRRFDVLGTGTAVAFERAFEQPAAEDDTAPSREQRPQRQR